MIFNYRRSLNYYNPFKGESNNSNQMNSVINFENDAEDKNKKNLEKSILISKNYIFDSYYSYD